MPQVKHQGPEPWETDLSTLWDKLTETRERAGLRRANQIAKRALDAAQGDQAMSTYVNQVDALFKAANPEAIAAGLRVLRDAAELDGDFDAADEYTQAIQSIMAATGKGPATVAAGTDTPAPEDVDPTDAEQVSKAIKKGQAAFKQAYAQQNGDDIRKRPPALALGFAQSPPRARSASPTAPAPDIQKLEKAKIELQEAQFTRQVADQIRKSVKR